MNVYLNTDMLTLTPPLEAYLKAQFGGLDTGNPALWQVYGSGLGAGPNHAGRLRSDDPHRRGRDDLNLPGWDYYSALAVRSVDTPKRCSMRCWMLSRRTRRSRS